MLSQNHQNMISMGMATRTIPKGTIRTNRTKKMPNPRTKKKRLSGVTKAKVVSYLSLQTKICLSLQPHHLRSHGHEIPQTDAIMAGRMTDDYPLTMKNGVCRNLLHPMISSQAHGEEWAEVLKKDQVIQVASIAIPKVRSFYFPLLDV
jgi:hypothetical protein